MPAQEEARIEVPLQAYAALQNTLADHEFRTSSGISHEQCLSFLNFLRLAEKPTLEKLDLPTPPERPAVEVVVRASNNNMELTIVQGPGSSEQLCLACQDLPFHQYATRDDRHGEETNGVVHLLRLDRVLHNKGWCRFCSLLFQAMCLEKNDPLRHPAVRNFIQPKLQGVSFERWAADRDPAQLRSRATWPFGHYAEPRPPERRSHPAPPTAISTGVMSDRARHVTTNMADRIIARFIDGDRDEESTLALPCWISVRSNVDKYTRALSLVVSVNSFGRVNQEGQGDDRGGLGWLHTPPLQCLSEFDLRITSTRDTIETPSTFEPRIDLSRAKLWLGFCESRHGIACRGDHKKEVPKLSNRDFRLIDVTKWRVIGADLSSPPRYLCLSYIWGQRKPSGQLLRDNLDFYKEAGSLSKVRLTQAVRDAITITNAVGERYLWVDTMCVIQDSEQDKAVQIRQMDRVFAASLVTIVLADGPDAESCVSGVSTDRAVDEYSIEVHPTIHVACPQVKKPLLGKSLWNTRAWTMQERLLSRRLLVFMSGFMTFHCSQGSIDETWKDSSGKFPPLELDLYNLSQPLSITCRTAAVPGLAATLGRSRWFDAYAALVTEYTPRHMTNRSDALHAVNGLLQSLSRHGTQPEFLRETRFGIPTNLLDLALLWYPAEGTDVRIGRRPGFPSWAWAGWEPLRSERPGQAHRGGVRYEESFYPWNDARDGSLQKILDPGAAEHVRPLLYWYVCHHDAKKGRKKLEKTNGHGMGVPIEQGNLPRAWEKLFGRLQESTIATEELSAEAWERVDGQHLIVKAQVARLKLGATTLRPETHYVFDAAGVPTACNEIFIPETQVLLESGKCIGRVVLPGSRDGLSGTYHDFMAISEAQYYGDEKHVSRFLVELPLYNVLMLQWDQDGISAERVALGKVEKKAFGCVSTGRRIVLLK